MDWMIVAKGVAAAACAAVAGVAVWRKATGDLVLVAILALFAGCSIMVG